IPGAQRQKVPDLCQGEAAVLRLLDKPDAPDRVLVIPSVATRTPVGGRDEAFLLVVAQGIGTDCRQRRELADRQPSRPPGRSLDLGVYSRVKGSLARRIHAPCGTVAVMGRPTLRIASKKRRGLPHSELMKIAVTLTAIATIAHTGWIRPVAARGM